MTRTFDALARDDHGLKAFMIGIGHETAPSRRAIVARCDRDDAGVLDIGCGPAVLARSFIGSSIASYIGCDDSPRMLELAHQTARAMPEVSFPVQFVTCDLVPRLAPRLRSHVVLRHVVEHQPFPGELLTWALRAARSRVVVVWSQRPSDSLDASRLTDDYLGIRRWAHPTAPLRAIVAAEGFTFTERIHAPHHELIVGEELWTLDRRATAGDTDHIRAAKALPAGAC